MTELPVVWRPDRSRQLAYPLAALGLVAMVALATVLPGEVGVADRVAFVAFGLLAACLLHLVARPKVVADVHGLTVVNALRSYRYGWAQVLRVSYSDGAPWPVVDLADGSSVGMMGIQGGNRITATRRLGELLRAHGEAPEPGQ